MNPINTNLTVTIGEITEALRAANIYYRVHHRGTGTSTVVIGDETECECLILGPARQDDGSLGEGVDSCVWSEASGDSPDWHPTLDAAVEYAVAYVARMRFPTTIEP